VNEPVCSPGKCAPGKQEVAEKVAAITGKAAGAASSLISWLRCARNDGQVAKKHAYVGFDTCQAASIAFGGPYECNFACIGYGDCEAACPFHAIHMKDNMPVIDPEACTGCGVCVKICPKQVLSLLPKDAICYVPCSNHTIRVHDANGVLRATLTGHTDWVYSVALSPDETKLASTSADGVTIRSPVS